MPVAEIGSPVYEDLLNEHGHVVTHKFIGSKPGLTSCTGTMRFRGWRRPYGGIDWDGTSLDRIAYCSSCGAEYAVQTGTGKGVRAGDIDRKDVE